MVKDMQNFLTTKSYTLPIIPYLFLAGCNNSTFNIAHTDPLGNKFYMYSMYKCKFIDEHRKYMICIYFFVTWIGYIWPIIYIYIW